MRLTRVELSRFVSRRAVALLLLAAALLTVLLAATTAWNTRPSTAHEVAVARAQAQQQAASAGIRHDLANCRTDPEQYLGPGSSAAGCTRQLTPTPSMFLDRSALSLDRERGTGGLTLVVVLAALMIIVGATFAGADWASGSMSNQLLVEPRRLRVWGAKSVAVTLGCGVTTVVLLAGFWAALLLVAQSRGIATPVAVQQEVAWMAGRGTLLAALAGLGGFALAMLLRSTVATLGLLFAYAAGGEALLALAPVHRSGLWSLTNNLFAWIRNGVQVFDEGIACRSGTVMCQQSYPVSLVHGSAFLGALLLAATVVSVLAFRRRDVA